MQFTKEHYKTIQNKIANHKITFAGGDGKSIDNPIIIMGTRSDTEDLISEQLFVTNKYG